MVWVVLFLVRRPGLRRREKVVVDEAVEGATEGAKVGAMDAVSEKVEVVAVVFDLLSIEEEIGLEVDFEFKVNGFRSIVIDVVGLD